jgi:tetratricopeptide (TPR) repeat protein
MWRKPQYVFLLLSALAFVVVSTSIYCTNSPQQQSTNNKQLTYLNHHDTVKYVGMNTCRACHADIHSTFIHTGMGKSFDKASKEKSSANFSHSAVYDKFRDFYYQPFWQGDKFYIKEYRLEGKDTIHSRLEQVNYIVGSGQHTNSHIIETNGYLNQAPLTFYTQDGRWDLPPGFEDGHNTRFDRIIGLECMSCHNGLPSFVQGSENRFTNIPNGIDCERCHGPGEVHVANIQAGKLVDTANEIDYSIVNPRKLNWERQIDLCQRCHLQGNAVLKEGKGFKDFRPGMVLSDFMDVYMPRYEGNDNEFIMASHAQRLQMSQCFIKSNKSALNNQKNSELQLTCITCHNPHKSVKVTGKQVFNTACNNCHTTQKCIEELSVRLEKNNNDCSSCHMPSTGTIDIPHVTVHDHYIRKPEMGEKMENADAVKKFIGIYAVNNPNSDDLTRGRAYLNYYEKFEPTKPELLDSAYYYLTKVKADEKYFIRWAYLKNDYKTVIKYGANAKNLDAWTAYRIGQAFYTLNDFAKAEYHFNKAVQKAPQNIEFKAKLATTKLQLKRIKEAEQLFKEVLNAYPKHVQSLTNLGYLYFTKGKIAEANASYDKALALDPDYEPALLNKAGLYNYLKDYGKAKTLLKRLLKRNPNNQQAKQALQQLNSL